MYALNAVGLGSGASSVDLENVLGNHRFGRGSSGCSVRGGGVAGWESSPQKQERPVTVDINKYLIQLGLL